MECKEKSGPMNLENALLVPSEVNYAILSSIPRAVSVTSGKGGVGKTSIVTNLAVCSALRGKRVLLIDCDLGLSNVDVLMGINPEINVLHALNGDLDLSDILVTGPYGVKVLPAPFATQETATLTREQKLNLLTMIEQLDETFDVIYLDTGAGISSNVMFFNMLANHTVVIMTPEPSSMTDSYALIKILHARHNQHHFHLLVNNVEDENDGRRQYRKLTSVTQNFLNVSINYLGCIAQDPIISRATMMCRPLATLFPLSETTTRFFQLAECIENFPAASKVGYEGLGDISDDYASKDKERMTNRIVS